MRLDRLRHFQDDPANLLQNRAASVKIEKNFNRKGELRSMGKNWKPQVLLLALALLLARPALAYDIGDGVSLAAGIHHTAMVDKDHTLWTWGSNTNGELGNGSRDSSSTPVKVMGQVATVSVGEGVTAALKTDRTLWMWGSNYHGQLGTNGAGDLDIGGGNSFDHGSKHFIQTTPVKVMDQVLSVCAGSFYTAAIREDHSLWMWGDNQYGHIGNGGEGNVTDKYGYVYQTVPVKVMDNVASVTFNEDAHAVAAIRTDGSLWMWGRTGRGVLGIGGDGNASYEIDKDTDDREYYQDTPVKILDGVSAVRIGANHAAAIRTDGSLWMWGSNLYGQLGNGTTNDSGVPIKIMDHVAAVDLGWSRTLALKTDGTLWSWGWNFQGRLGTGAEGDSHVPVKIMDGVAAIGGDRDHAAALKKDGSLWMWGWNYYGQLGSGTTADSPVPIKVLDNVVAVRGARGSTTAVRKDGSLWSWGWNYFGQLGNGTTTDSVVPAATGQKQ